MNDLFSLGNGSKRKMPENLLSKQQTFESYDEVDGELGEDLGRLPPYPIPTMSRPGELQSQKRKPRGKGIKPSGYLPTMPTEQNISYTGAGGFGPTGALVDKETKIKQEILADLIEILSDQLRGIAQKMKLDLQGGELGAIFGAGAGTGAINSNTLNNMSMNNMNSNMSNMNNINSPYGKTRKTKGKKKENGNIYDNLVPNTNPLTFNLPPTTSTTRQPPHNLKFPQELDFFAPQQQTPKESKPKRKVIREDEKMEMIKKAEEIGAADVARMYGIHPSCISRWKGEMKAAATNVGLLPNKLPIDDAQ